MEMDSKYTAEEQKSIERLRTLLDNQEKLSCPKEEEFLIKFLRAKKFDEKKAFSLIRSYFSIKKILDPILNTGDIEEIVKPLLLDYKPWILRQPDRHGRTVMFLADLSRWDPSKVPVAHMQLSHLIALEELMSQERNQQNGLVFVADRDGMRFSHYRAMFKTAWLFLSIACQETNFPIPCRVKGIHMINNSPYSVYRVMRPFLHKKIQERIFVHDKADFSDLHKFVPPESLPTKYGGKLTMEQARDPDFPKRALSKENLQRFYRLMNYGFKS